MMVTITLDEKEFKEELEKMINQLLNKRGFNPQNFAYSVYWGTYQKQLVINFQEKKDG